MTRIQRCLLTVWLCLLAGTMLACGGPWRDGYFKKGLDRLTQDQVLERFGPPHTSKMPVLGGDSVWTYRVPVAEKELSPLHFPGLSSATTQAVSMIGKPGEAPKEMLYCYRYILTFNEQKILKQWKREECVPGTHDLLNPD
ncbi:MAG: hypothetical protein NTX84_10425 [Nitrospirae bacterium]|nr:hypothetical protein [Nitrospirota bacterium]